MHRCAFLTLEDRADFCIYDELLFEPFAAIDWQVEEIPWNRPGVDWAAFDAVIIRSTWDYQDDLSEFLATLAGIDAVSRLYNPLPVCHWNSNKRYLRDLAQRGVTIVPTRFSAGLTVDTLDSAFGHFAAPKIVAKPAVGANADHTHVLTAGPAADWGEALAAHRDRELLLQPFLESIHKEGEYSLFYFGGELSHVIRKRPAAGDFRVQEEHGGQIQWVESTPELRAAGEQCMAAIGENLLYARVDLVRLDTKELALMEVELIEPSLYFDQDPGAAQRFTDAFQLMVPVEPR